jgi:cell division septum initiation protein DivIVA
MPPDGSEQFRPDTVARKSFGTSFRGFDQLEVRGWLNELSHELRRLNDRCADLEAKVTAAETRAADADNLDDAQLTARLGEETARILQAARDAAADTRAKAEESVARMLREAQDDVTRMRQNADAEYAKRLEDAELVAHEIRQSAETTRAQTIEAGESEREAAREEGRSMVAEAQAVRERVLQDLARRRKVARQQVEQLRAGRQRLLDAYEVVRQTLEEATTELRVAWPEARLAAETAGRRVADDHLDPTVAEMEAELDEARHAEDDGEAAEEAPAESEVAGAPVAAVEEEEVAPISLPPVSQRSGGRRKTPSVASQLPEAELVPLRVTDPNEAVRLVEPPEPEEPEAAEPVEPVVEGGVAELFARLRASQGDAPEPAEAEEPGVAEAAAEPASEPDTSPEAVARLALLERRDATTDAVESRLARRLKRTLSDEQNEVLDALRRARKSDGVDVLPPASEQASRYAGTAASDLAAAAEGGVAFFEAAEDGDGVEAPEVDDLASDLAAMIVGLLRERVERAVREADVDADADDLAERIRACYREWKTQRIGETSRHFVLAAFNRGVYAAQPPGTKLCWLVDDGGSPCPDAEDNALAGPTVKGDSFPTGHRMPPAHPGCQCVLVTADALSRE